MKRCKKLLSVLCAAVLLLELLPGSVLGAPVVGETLSSHGATATVTNLYEYGKSQVVAVLGAVFCSEFSSLSC